MRDETAEIHIRTVRIPPAGRRKQPGYQRSIYFFSSGFQFANDPWFGAPKPNAAGVIPFCPCPIAPKLNGEVTPPPVDVEGVTGVNVNGDGLGPVPSFVVVVVVPGVFEKLKENAGLSVAGAGVDGVVVVGNVLAGVDIGSNALPFLNGLGPGLEVSCFGARDEKILGEVPVVAGVVNVVDGKATFGSDPPAGLFTPKFSRG